MATASTTVQGERYEPPSLTVLGTFQELTGKPGSPVDATHGTSGAAPTFQPGAYGGSGTYGGR